VKLTIDSKALRELADWAARIAPPRPSSPVLSGVLLAAGGAGGLVATATDYDVWGVGSYPADVQSSGTACLGARLLAELAAGMPPGPVDMVLDGTRMTIRGGRAVATAPTMPAEDYPPPPATAGGQVLAVPGGLLAKVLGAAAKIAGSAKPALALYVILEARPEGLRATASDSYRIISADLPWVGDGPVETREAVVAAAGAQAVADLAKAGQMVSLAFPDGEHGVLSASADGRRLASRQMANPKRIPVDKFDGPKPHRFQVGRELWSDLADRAGRRCVDKTPLRCTVVDGTLTAVGGSEDEGSFLDVIEVSGDASWPVGGMTVALNPAYLTSLLDVLPGELVSVGMSKPHLPVVLRPVGDGLPYQVTCVMMPVRIPEGTG
jgi:DNA polymerase III subunit beta